MGISISQKAALDVLLNKGLFADAAKFLESLGGPAAASAAAPAAAAAPPAPRSANAVILEAFQVIAALLGNNPTIAALLPELEAVLTVVEAAKGA
jgi:hypothetical protein